MPTMINPFRGIDPTAKMISDLGDSLFGNTGAGALRKEQIIAAQRGNDGQDRLDKAIMADPQGMAGVMATPLGQAFIAASGRAPKDFADLSLSGSAMQNGATSPTTQNAQVGAGQSYDNTADAVNAKLAETKRQFDMKPIEAFDSAGEPAFATQGNTAGFTPAIDASKIQGNLLSRNFNNLPTLNPNQLAAINADVKPGSVASYLTPAGTIVAGQVTSAGIVDPTTGKLLPEGSHPVSVQGGATDVGAATKTVTSNVQGSIIQNNSFNSLADAMISLTDQHPEAFGLYGQVAGGVQNVLQSANVLIDQMGGKANFDSMLDQASNSLKQNGASPDILSHFNKSIAAVDTLGPLMAYQTASAIAGQSGRSASDNDIKTFLGVIGDPQGWLASAPEVKTKISILKEAVKQAQILNQQYLEKGIQPTDDIAQQALARAVTIITNGPADPLVQPTTAPTPGGPPAAPAPATGQPVQIKGDDDYNALPSGTVFVDPEGNKRTKP